MSRNAIADRVKELAGDLATQLAEEARSYLAFSLAVDESADNSDTAQLSIFVRGVKSDLSVTEELLNSGGYWVRRMRQLPRAPLFWICQEGPLLKMACVVLSYFVAF